MLKKITSYLSALGWLLEFCLSGVAVSVAAACGMTGWPLTFFGAFTAILIAVGLHHLWQWLRSKQWPETRNVSDLGVTHPLASTRELEADVVSERTVLIERVINGDNMIVGKTFVNCSIIGPAVLFSNDPWPVSEFSANIRDERHLGFVFLPVAEDYPVHGGIQLRGCTFKKCKLFFINMVLRVPVVTPSNPDTSAASPRTDPPAHSGGAERES